MVDWLKKLYRSPLFWWIAPVALIVLIAAIAVVLMETSALLPLMYSGTGG